MQCIIKFNLQFGAVRNISPMALLGMQYSIELVQYFVSVYARQQALQDGILDTSIMQCYASAEVKLLTEPWMLS